jgi:hypothetical protein
MGDKDDVVEDLPALEFVEKQDEWEMLLELLETDEDESEPKREPSFSGWALVSFNGLLNGGNGGGGGGGIVDKFRFGLQRARSGGGGGGGIVDTF